MWLCACAHPRRSEAAAHFESCTAGAAELRRARDYLIGQFELSLENTESQMNWVGEQILGFNRIIPPDEIKARLNEIRPGDIRRVAHDFFQPERLCLSLVSPLKSNRGLRKLLEF